MQVRDRSTVTRGLMASAVGTVALNVSTYLDMAIRGRPSSSAPQETVAAIQRLVGGEPGDGSAETNRRQGGGALMGYLVGLGVGTAATALLGKRRPGVGWASLLGLAAMAASDVPMVALGVTDPRSWRPQDYLSDVVPHLVYGAATVMALRATQPRIRLGR